MSNIIPPLLSSSPPPIIGPLDEEDDEFGDFRAAATNSYDCDEFSLPSSIQNSPDKELKPFDLDINSNTNEEPIIKDFQDKRKSSSNTSDENNVNSSESRNNFNIEENIDDDDDKYNYCVIDKQLDENSIAINNGISNSQEDLDLIVETNINRTSVDESIHEVEEEEEENNLASNHEAEKEENSSDSSHEAEEEVNTLPKELCNESIKNVEVITQANSSSYCLGNEEEEEENEITSTTNRIVVENSSILENIEVDNTLPISETVENFGFGDFENYCPSITIIEEIQTTTDDVEDDFGDFETATSIIQTEIAAPTTTEEEDDDEFGEFIDSQLLFEEKPLVLLDLTTTNILEKTELILKEIFQISDKVNSDYEDFESTKNNFLFSKLKDLTETNALNYQWAKSASQKMFLKSLNIDTRNILHGPAWNPSMPRFAANLSFAPLEPIKSDLLIPTTIVQSNITTTSIPSNSSQIINQNTTTTTTTVNVEIPTAQFDWSDSGLINPLDSSVDTTNNNETSSAKNNVEKLALSTTPPIFLPKTEIDLIEPLSINMGLTPTLSLRDNLVDKIKNTPSTTSSDHDEFAPFQSSVNMIPLRETHISNDFEQKPSWLEPTIVTPELPKKINIVNNNNIEQVDDDFSDFQMVLPEHDLNNENSSSNKHITTISGPINLTNLQQQQEEMEEEKEEQKQEEKKSTTTIAENDDEFTDFHSSVPMKPLQPIPIEPLKPSIQYVAPLPTQINWPDPGVTDDDIRNIELSYSRQHPIIIAKKENSLAGDEEWSDFVSVVQSNPVINKTIERTSTPDLPLSVLNLNHVQPSKQPIPVITPSGLVQTRLSSSVEPKTSNIVQTSIQPCQLYKPTVQLQPSIISNQFASAKNSIGFNNDYNENDDDDDDWSDFVSSQPVTTTTIANGFEQKSINNWSSATTNIITNPGHFDSLQNYVQKVANVQTKKNLIPSISAIPDLDFIAPKNRTNNKK